MYLILTQKLLHFKIVREQCWLNETLSICEWLPEGLSMIDIEPAPEEGATEEELDAVLKGPFIGSPLVALN